MRFAKMRGFNCRREFWVYGRFEDGLEFRLRADVAITCQNQTVFLVECKDYPDPKSGRENWRHTKQCKKYEASKIPFALCVGTSEIEGTLDQVVLPESIKAAEKQYLLFRQACEEFGMAVIDSDFSGVAWFEWLKLDVGQRIEAVSGIRARSEAGVDPQMVPRPEKYLKTKEWQRPILRKESAQERAIRQAIS